MLTLQTLFRGRPKRLTASQRKVVDYILARPEDAVFASAVELGQRIGVSDATVVRVCQALGYEGLIQLKEHLRRRIFNNQDTVTRLSESVDQAASVESLMLAVMRKDQDNLARTMEAAPAKTLAAAARLLAQSSEVAVIGLRSAYSLAHFSASALRYLGRKVELLTPGTGYIWAEARTLGPGAVLLAFSFPRYTSLTVQVAKELHQGGVKVIAVTDSELSPLAQHADFVLPAPCGVGSFVESFVAPLSLVNALVTAVAYLDGEHSLDHLKKLERIWREKGVYLRPEPEES